MGVPGACLSLAIDVLKGHASSGHVLIVVARPHPPATTAFTAPSKAGIIAPTAPWSSVPLWTATTIMPLVVLPARIIVVVISPPDRRPIAIASFPAAVLASVAIPILALMPVPILPATALILMVFSLISLAPTATVRRPIVRNLSIWVFVISAVVLVVGVRRTAVHATLPARSRSKSFHALKSVAVQVGCAIVALPLTAIERAIVAALNCLNLLTGQADSIDDIPASFFCLSRSSCPRLLWNFC